MENGTGRHSGNPITLQVQRETAERMVPEGTHDHQGRSRSAHAQAGYRRAVQSPFSMTIPHLAPLGESI